MPIPATNIKTISKIDSFLFIKISFSACFCSVVIILYFTIYRNRTASRRSQFVKIVCAMSKHIPPERSIVVVGKFPYGEPPFPVREDSLCNVKTYYARA